MASAPTHAQPPAVAFNPAMSNFVILSNARSISATSLPRTAVWSSPLDTSRPAVRPGFGPPLPCAQRLISVHPGAQADGPKSTVAVMCRTAGSSYWAQKCRSQANSVMRQSQSALRLLLRMQAARQKLEADSEARNRAAWTEHCALGLMAQALSEQAAVAEPPAPSPASEPQPEPQPAQQPHPDPLLVAQNDKAISPRRADLLRLMERLSGPPDDDLIYRSSPPFSHLP